MASKEKRWVMVGRARLVAMAVLALVVASGAVAKVRSTHPQNLTSEALQGTITLGTNRTGGAFSFGPLAKSTSAVIRNNVSVFVQATTFKFANSIDELFWSDPANPDSDLR